MADMFRLDGRVALVIGSGAGIGKASAEALAAQGATVVGADNRPGAAEEIVEVSDNASVAALVKRVVDQYGRLDVAVSTPGINVRKLMLNYTAEEFDRVVAVNLRGTFNVLKEAGAVMAAAGKGSIIAFSSVRSVTVEPGQSVYAATKTGVVQLVRGAACELGPKGVRVNAVAPGVVETPLTAPIKSKPDWYNAYAAKNILNRWAQPSEMAWPVCFLASDAASYITGSVMFVDGGFTAQDGRFTPPL